MSKQFKLGEVEPWTNGNSTLALEYKEEIGYSVNFQAIEDKEGNVIAWVDLDPELAKPLLLALGIKTDDCLVGESQRSFDLQIGGVRIRYFG